MAERGNVGHPLKGLSTGVSNAVAAQVYATVHVLACARTLRNCAKYMKNWMCSHPDDSSLPRIVQDEMS